MRSIFPRLLLAVAVTVSVTAFISCRRIDMDRYTEEGVSKMLATYRNATVSNIHYILSFSIEEGKDSPVDGRAIGRILGDRDHTTVMNALNRVDRKSVV